MDEDPSPSSDDSSTESSQKEGEDGVKELIKELRDEVTKRAKEDGLRWAIDHAHLGRFSYIQEDDKIFESTELIRKILFSFRQGNGYQLDSSLFRVPIDGGDPSAEFVRQLERQLHDLMGVKPNFVKTGFGHHWVTYS